jgi:hypothetical protein
MQRRTGSVKRGRLRLQETGEGNIYTVLGVKGLDARSQIELVKEGADFWFVSHSNRGAFFDITGRISPIFRSKPQSEIWLKKWRAGKVREVE